MSNPTPGLQHLRQFIDAQVADELSDDQLLQRFAMQRDEASFSTLVRRHGPMVLNTSRRILHPSQQDAEDVCQLTFLVLARNAGSIHRRDALGGWLHRVALRLAQRCRAQNVQRRSREQQRAESATVEKHSDGAWTEIQEVIDAELERLPARYREPLLLCYLEGKTHEEIARQLGHPLGTVRTWVARGREMLRKRLQRRGLALPGASFAGLLALQHPANAALPACLFRNTVQAALDVAAGKQAPASASASAAALLLVKYGTPSVLTRRFSVLVALLIALGVAGVGATVAFWHSQHAAAVADKGEQESAALPTDQPQPARTDLQGNPLPPGALARMGAVRLWHKQFFQSVAFSPDLKILASVKMFDESTVRLWEAATCQEICTLKEHDGKIWSFAFSPDGKILASGGDQTIRLWEVATGKEIRSLKGDQGRIHAIAFSPDGKILASGSADKTLRLWELATGNEIRALQGHEGGIAFSPDGKTLASSTVEKTIRLTNLWETAAGKESRTLKGHGSVAFSPDGKTLASWVIGDQTIRLWDVATDKEIRTLRYSAPAYQGNYAVAFSPDGKTLASASVDNTLRLWEATTGKQVHILRLPFLATAVPDSWNQTWSVAFSPDGKSLASWTHDTLRLWDVATGKQIRKGHDGAISSVAFSPDGKTLVSRSVDRVLLWEAATGKEIHPLDGLDGASASVAFSPDGQMLASWQADRDAATIRLCDAATGKEIHSLKGPDGQIQLVAFSGDGKTLASAGNHGDDWTIRLWETATGTEIRTFKGHDGAISSVAFSPDGKTLASSSLWKLRLWEATTGKEIRSLKGRIFSVAFSPDGKTLASVVNDLEPGHRDDWTIRLWEAATGKEMHILKGHDKRIRSITFSPDGKTLASWGLEDATIRLWEAATGKEIRTLKGHDKWISSVAFSPDGKTLASAGDQTIRLWEAATGKVLHAFKGHSSDVSCIAFSLDGKTLASGSDDTTVLVWDVYGDAQRSPAELSGKDLDTLWSELASDEAAHAYGAMAILVRAHGASVPFLKKKARPVEPVGPQRLAQLIGDLDSKEFDVRRKAGQALEQLGDQAETALRRVLDGNPSLEVQQRVQTLLEKEKTRPWEGERLRLYRVIQVLEAIGTPEAQALLKTLAAGAPSSRLTQEAQASLERLAKRAGNAP